MSIILNAITSKSYSEAYTGYNLVFNLGLFVPITEDTSTAGNHTVKAAQKLTTKIINDTSQAKSYDLFVNNSWYLGSKIAKSTSLGLEFGLSIGEPQRLEQAAAVDYSQVITPKLKLNVFDMFEFNDDVYLLVMDNDDNFKVYRGAVRDKNQQSKRVNVKAIMGEGILSERIIRENYEKQDVGFTAKQIIETYCSPLTAENINTNTGYKAPIQAKNKTALSVLENIRREYGLFYYVDYAWNVHLYRDDEITEPDLIKIRLGD